MSNKAIVVNENFIKTEHKNTTTKALERCEKQQKLNKNKLLGRPRRTMSTEEALKEL